MCTREQLSHCLVLFQVLRLPRITPQDMQRQTRARVAEFRRVNHIRGPEANSKSFTTIMSGSHRLSLPDGGGLKRQVEEQDLKMAGQLFAVLQNVMKTCNDMDATEQKFLEQVNQLWNQDFAEVIRQVNCARGACVLACCLRPSFCASSRSDSASNAPLFSLFIRASGRWRTQLGGSTTRWCRNANIGLACDWRREAIR
jgi:hypothetical protein